VRVHCDEGVAIHIGPEPCVAVREGRGEASVGESIGQPLSLENYINRDADAGAHRGRQHGQARERERLDGPAWSQTLACAEAPCTGTGRSRVWPTAEDAGGPHREGEEP
jgi:hypothetical protein